MSFMRRLERIRNSRIVRSLLSTIPYTISGITLILVVVVLIAGVFLRNVGVNVRGIQAFAQLFGVWITFIIMGALAYEDRHIDVAYFTDKLPEWAQYYHNIAVSILNVVFVVVFTYGSILGFFRFWDSVAPGAPIPVPLFYLSMVLGGILITTVYVVNLASLIVYDRAWVEGGYD